MHAHTLSRYLLVTKPGIVVGNLLTAVSGFLIAWQGKAVDHPLQLLVAMGLALTCIIAAACTFNNMIDRHHDALMERTKHRPLASKALPLRSAFLFGALLLLVGSTLLYFYTNLLTLSLALSGFGIYVLLYSVIKYHTPWATLVGSFAGAAPIVCGYCSVKGGFDLGALLLLAVLVLWQMPHFFAIALYRLEDYRRGGIPVLPVVRGEGVTRLRMRLYLAAFLASLFSLWFYGFLGSVGALLVGGVSLGWFRLALFSRAPTHAWAKKMFRWSLLAILALFFAAVFGV